mmetsp:Transcript_18754/g.70971  ORF Transcript_18754/g.70971 Transcript_18754/m.70971 type:complete len:340 (+) Transcript_18754:1040-2059(+)
MDRRAKLHRAHQPRAECSRVWLPHHLLLRLLEAIRHAVRHARVLIGLRQASNAAGPGTGLHLRVAPFYVKLGQAEGCPVGQEMAPEVIEGHLGELVGHQRVLQLPILPRHLKQILRAELGIHLAFLSLGHLLLVHDFLVLSLSRLDRHRGRARAQRRLRAILAPVRLRRRLVLVLPRVPGLLGVFDIFRRRSARPVRVPVLRRRPPPGLGAFVGTACPNAVLVGGLSAPHLLLRRPSGRLRRANLLHEARHDGVRQVRLSQASSVAISQDLEGFVPVPEVAEHVDLSRGADLDAGRHKNAVVGLADTVDTPVRQNDLLLVAEEVAVEADEARGHVHAPV